jgi:hypothetical protein
MSAPPDRRLLAVVGAAVALLLAVGAALLLSRGPHQSETATSTESTNLTGSNAGGLKVEMAKTPKLESDTSVRCFVNGQFVGMQTAAACAQKNGVAPGALGVGLDQSGAIAAGGGDTHLAPLAGAANAVADADADASDSIDRGDGGPGDAADSRDDRDPTGTDAEDYADAPPALCGRMGPGGGARPTGPRVSLDACVHNLFDGRCPPPGQVAYGRWGALTLRASPGRIDLATDGRDFRALAPQYPSDCSIPSL